MKDHWHLEYSLGRQQSAQEEKKKKHHQKNPTSLQILLINLSSDPDLTSYKSDSGVLHVVIKYKESIVEKARD